MDCQIEKNKARCPCTYEPCSRKGKCCECILYHKEYGELPACLFPPEVEKSYDRSIGRFVKTFAVKVKESEQE
ncbi:MAG: hypothetical protein E3J67_01450 [Dehalococcoidia bacterium]|nr:MAG: hypothetical protein E3J67_01450 [Dehalococcoidia bacterium]